MSEMLERMCRAATTAGSGNPWFWDDSSFVMQEAWRIQMRAAIAAMREPTEAMINAARSIESVDLLGNWRAMIDEALK